MPFGSARAREVPNQLARELVYFSTPEIVKFFAFGTENRRTEDGRYADAPAIEDISVHRKVSYFPFAFSPISTSRRFFKTLFRQPTASTVRFNLLAITILSILDSSNARS
jgi:hypothetical protein